jgi:predicted HTH domain antitoxin
MVPALTVVRCTRRGRCKVAQLLLSYPDEFESALLEAHEEMEAHIRLMAALKMFELGKLSSGKAAELAGVSSVEFLDICGRYHVPVASYAPEELVADLRADLEEVE